MHKKNKTHHQSQPQPLTITSTPALIVEAPTAAPIQPVFNEIRQYKLLSEINRSVTDFETMVNELLKDGWELSGGTSVTAVLNGYEVTTMYTQSFTK